MVKLHDQKRRKGSLDACGPRGIEYMMARELGNSRGKRLWWLEQKPSWSHFIHTQETKRQQEVEPGCKSLKVHPQWPTSSSKASPPKSSITCPTVPPTRDWVSDMNLRTCHTQATTLLLAVSLKFTCCLSCFEFWGRVSQRGPGWPQREPVFPLGYSLPGAGISGMCHTLCVILQLHGRRRSFI